MAAVIKKIDFSGVVPPGNEVLKKSRNGHPRRAIKSVRIPIEEAEDVLDRKFDTIFSVEKWAEQMGYSKSYFWRKFESCFKKTPRRAFIEKKKAVLTTFLEENRTCKSSEAARKIHLMDGNGLYQFVRRHFNCTPTELKQRIGKKTEKK